MSTKRFVSIERTIPGGFFKEGEHKVIIESASDELARQNKEFTDRTPQVKLTFRNDEGVLSHWYNLKGFVKLDKEENPKASAPAGYEYRQATDDAGNGIGEFYLVQVKTGARVEDKGATTLCQEIFAGVASDAGIKAGTEFDLADLKGKEIGIKVRNRADSRGPEVQYTMKADKVKGEILAD